MSEDVALNMRMDDWIEYCGYEASKNGWHNRFNALQRAAYEESVGVDDVAGGSEEAMREHVIAKTSLIGVEVSEAIEELRNGHPFDKTYQGQGGKPEGFPVELADIVIRVLDVAYMLNIDLTHVMDEKLRYNKSRGHMHGGKKV